MKTKEDLLAENLTDYVNEHHNQDECSGFIDGFNKGFKAADQFTPKQEDKWIDVKKKLPVLSDYYLICSVDGSLNKIAWFDMDKKEFNGEDYWVYDLDYWQPLPSPPLTYNKEENGK